MQITSYVENELTRKIKISSFHLLLLASFIDICELFMGTSASRKMVEPVIKMPKGKHEATLIFLHGLGDTGHGWADSLGSLGIQNLKIICPTAPTKPVTINHMMRMPSWFDIIGLTPDAPQDEKGIIEASEMLKDMIKQEASLVPQEKIFVGGFSQGGAVSLYTAMTMGKPLAGIVGLSTWLPIHTKILGQINDMNVLKKIPMFQGHGTADMLVPYAWGNMTKENLSKIMSNYEFKSYANMGHSSCPEELEDVKNFIIGVLGS